MLLIIIILSNNIDPLTLIILILVLVMAYGTHDSNTNDSYIGNIGNSVIAVATNTNN